MQHQLFWGFIFFVLMEHTAAMSAENTIAPTTNTELQRHMASCASHSHNIVERMKLSNPEDSVGFRNDVIAALDTLVLCRKQEAEALKLRNNAQYTPPVHPYSDL